MNQPSKTQKNGELVFGVHAVLELLRAKRRKVLSIYTTKPVPKAWPDIEKELPRYPVNIQYVERDVLTRIAGTTDHQGILAWAQPFAFRKKFFEPAKHPLLLMLDSIQDVGNLGAILRSAYCTGVDGVIITEKNSAPLNATALKASAGLAERLEIYLAPSAQSAIQDLKAAGYTPYLTAFDGTDATKTEYTTPLCIVIGGEGMGITKAILGSGPHITIPQRSKDISYNASVAAGIALFIVSQKMKLS